MDIFVLIYIMKIMKYIHLNQNHQMSNMFKNNFTNIKIVGVIIIKILLVVNKYLFDDTIQVTHFDKEKYVIDIVYFNSFETY